jgi:hypothetical protein
MSLFVDENKIQENYNKFMDLIGQDERSEQLKNMYEDLKDELMTAPASAVIHYHNAFPGGYLDHVLRVHDTAIQVAKLYREMGGTLEFTVQELRFAALHHDLGKLGEPGQPYYIDQDSDWHRKNMGKMYKYNGNDQYMKVTDRALYMLQRYDVKVTRNEWIAIQLSDGIYDEANKSYLMNNLHPYPFTTNLPHIIHTADYLSCQLEKANSRF